jgi:hypothetical protein
LDSPVERHQVIFINPDLIGIYAAFLAHRAGARVAIVDEFKKWQTSVGDYPAAFPANGTFRSGEVDLLAREAGFPPPIWDKVCEFQLATPTCKVSLNSESGLGGLLLNLAQPFKIGRSVVSGWLQDQMIRAREFLSVGSETKIINLKKVETSVADAILSLRLEEPDPLILLLDVFSIMVLGRGVMQVDVRDFYLVLCTFLEGWHVPAPGERSWAEILLIWLRKHEARYHELESIVAVQNFGKRSSVVRGSDGALFAGQLLVVPECDRFRHPTTTELNTIRWHNWEGRFSEIPPGPSRAGIVRSDAKRSPVNDNFIAWRISADRTDNRFTVSAPVECRFIVDGRLDVLTSRIGLALGRSLDWKIAEVKAVPVETPRTPINLPGASPALSYPEEPLWGDDVLSRLKAATQLSRRVVESIK